MMTNSFSVFDASTNILYFSLNLISSILGIMLLPFMNLLVPNRFLYLWNKMLLTLNLVNITLLGASRHSGETFLFISIFFIMFNKFMWLFPYIFTSSSHMSMTLALPLWLSFMLYVWIKHTNHMFAHLMPQGTLSVLMTFMVYIETISNFIRSGTWAVRLAANMFAGYLLQLFWFYWTSNNIILINFLLIIIKSIFIKLLNYFY